MLSDTCRLVPTFTSVPETILPAELIPPTAVTLPVPDKVPSKKVSPLTPKLLPN